MTAVANSVHRHEQSIDLGIPDSDTALQETSIYGIMIILTELLKATTNIGFFVNVWCGVIGDQLIGPYIFSRLTGDF